MPAYRHLSILAIILVATAVFFLAQADSQTFVQRYAAIPNLVSGAWEALVGGQLNLAVVRSLSRLFSAVLLHVDMEHILYNMVFLWAFGTLASEYLGQWWALLVFAVCGVAGNVAQVCLNLNSPIPILGASGGVTGFEGLYLGLALRWQLPWPDVWPLAHPIPPLQLAAFGVVGFLFDAYSLMNHDQGIAYGAHLGGFVSGLVIAVLITTIYSTRSAFDRAGAKR